MNKNIDKNLFFDEINDISNVIENDEQQKFCELIINYDKLISDNISILNIMLDDIKNKAIIVYNFGLVIELFLKMILLKYGLANILDISKYNHNISDMYNDIFKSNINPKIKKICSNIKDRATLIKQSNGNTVNYNDYANFRYNHKKRESDLIFNEDIKNDDIKHIKEAIECIEKIMKL